MGPWHFVLMVDGTSQAVLLWVQVMEETGKMLKRHKQRFLGELHVDQQKLRAQLEVLRSDVEAFAELGDVAQVSLVVACSECWCYARTHMYCSILCFSLYSANESYTRGHPCLLSICLKTYSKI